MKDGSLVLIVWLTARCTAHEDLRVSRRVSGGAHWPASPAGGQEAAGLVSARDRKAGIVPFGLALRKNLHFLYEVPV